MDFTERKSADLLSGNSWQTASKAVSQTPEQTPSELLKGPLIGSPTAKLEQSLSEKANPVAVTQMFAHYGDEIHPAPHADRAKDKVLPAPPVDKAGDAKHHPATVHTGLGNKIDEMIAKSPTLEHNLETLQKRGWTIQYGHKGGGTFADRTKKTITVDPNEKGDSKELLQSIAHESGHAMYTPGAYVPFGGLTRQQYIDRNVDNQLKDEGEATITNMEVRAELLKAKQGNIGVSGAKSKEYLELYKHYPQAKDRDKLRQEIGKVFAHGEHPSTAPKKDYADYYAKPYAETWDKSHPPPHHP